MQELGCQAETRHLVDLHMLPNSGHQPAIPNTSCLTVVSGIHLLFSVITASSKRESIFLFAIPNGSHRASIVALQNLPHKNPQRTVNHSE